MLAAIDAGSNTFRLLIGKVVEGKVVPQLYQRCITRLAGGFSEQLGLSFAARERALEAFKAFADTCRQYDVRQVRAIGTAAFRRAKNGQAFVAEVWAATGLSLDIIGGILEAEYMAIGVLSALDPLPTSALIVDIGGGSTEFVLYSMQQVVWSRSLPLGVVCITEEYTSSSERQSYIKSVVSELLRELGEQCHTHGIESSALALVGTAGTVTTMAALDLQMTEYDWQRVNNYGLSRSCLESWQARLAPLTPAERETLPGMEAGRGDLIPSGLEIVLCLMKELHMDRLIVSDFGILEGLLLSL